MHLLKEKAMRALHNDTADKPSAFMSHCNKMTVSSGHMTRRNQRLDSTTLTTEYRS